MASFRCYENSDVNVTLIMTHFHLYLSNSTVVMSTFPNVCLCGDVVMLKLDPEKQYRATFVCQYGLCCFIVWPSFLFDCFVKIYATCKNFFGQMVYRPPGKKIACKPLPLIESVRQGFSRILALLRKLRSFTPSN